MKKQIKNFSDLVAFPHTIFSAAFIGIAMIVSSHAVNNSAWMGFKSLFLCALALSFARNFAMGFNRLTDRDIDAKNARTKNRPSVDGRLSLRAQKIFCAINVAGFIATSYFINTLALALSAPFLAILALYSYMKRFSFLAHIVLGISLGLAPIAGNIAISGEIHAWCIALASGVVFWVAGFDLLYSLQDIAFDRAHALHSIPARFGEKNTLKISRIFHILAVGFWAIFVYLANLKMLAIIGLAASALMLVYEQFLVAKDFKNIPRAFFTTNGYLGFVFFVFVLFDIIFRDYL